jgi:cytochrome P450
MTDARTAAEDVTVEDLERDPYPVYARLRATAPVAYVPAVDLWLVTRWADVRTVAGDPAGFSAEMDDSPLDLAFGGPSILTTDGPAHRDIRRSLDAKYAPRVVRGYIDDLVGPIVEQRLAALAGRGSVDLLAEYFEPVSVLSLGSVLGLGQLDADTLRRWFHGLHQGAINFERDPRRRQVSDAVAAEIDEVLVPLLARISSADEDSTIAHMLFSGVADDGGRRDVSAIMPTLKVILLGGMQEPGHGAASTTYALLSDPEALARVRRDPEAVVPVAVEEGLRWMSPIGTQTRQVRREVELGGTTLPVGARVGAVVASANRDETVYPDPDRFSLDRPRGPHAAFGFGLHACVGHAFSRSQIAIALRRLLETFPGLRLDETEETVFTGWEFRAPRALHVRLD